VSSEGLATKKRVLVAIAAISLFILGMILSQWIFSFFQIESITSGVMSVVSGTIIAWIVLMLSGILKEFTIKGASFELSSKLKEFQDEMKTSNKEICGKINNVNQNIQNSFQNINTRIDSIVNTVSTSNSESRMVNYYFESKGALQGALKESGITGKALDPKTDVSKEKLDNLDALFTRVKTLEESLSKPIKLSTSEIMSRANYFFYKKEYHKAIKRYEDVLKVEPDSLDALFNTGFSNYELSNIDKSISFYSKVLEIDPENVVTLHNMSLSYLALNNPEKSLEYLNKAIDIEPTDILLLTRVAQNYRLLQDYEKCIEVLKKAEKIKPDSTDVIEGFAHAYYWRKDIKNTEYYANKMLIQNPKSVKDKIANGVTYLLLREYEKSEEVLEDAIIDQPNSGGAWYNLACTKSKLKKYDETLKLLQRAIKINGIWKITVKVDPDLEEFRKTPQFEKMFLS